MGNCCSAIADPATAEFSDELVGDALVKLEEACGGDRATAFATLRASYEKLLTQYEADRTWKWSFPPLPRPRGRNELPDDEYASLIAHEHLNDERELHALRTVDFFVLDNSLRETTVATMKGHTLENKKQILQAIRSTGYDEIILGTFGATENVDDSLPAAWRQWGETMDNVWGLCDIPCDYRDIMLRGAPITSDGFEELVQYGFCNVVFEIDPTSVRFGDDACAMVEYVMRFVREAHRRLSKRRVDGKSRVMFNLRDFTLWPDKEAGFRRTLNLIKAFSQMPVEERLFGLIYEEPSGLLLPETVGTYTRLMRKTMVRYGWPDGKLLFHVHANFGNCDAAFLKAAANGCNGIWGAVCRSGAQLGHASSAVALVNLARLGNESVMRRYNIPKVIAAARRVHEIATLTPCDPFQEVYGAQAFDMVFGSGPMSSDDVIRDIATRICGERTFVRVQVFSSVDMIAQAMTERFGPPAEVGWDPAVCEQMRVIIHNGLIRGARWEYNSPIGLCQLYHHALEFTSPGAITLPAKMMELASKDIPPSHPLLLEVERRYLEVLDYQQRKGTSRRSSVFTTSKSERLSMMTSECSLVPQASVLYRNNRCDDCGGVLPAMFHAKRKAVPDSEVPPVPTRTFLKALFAGRPAFYEKALEHVPPHYKESIPWSEAKFHLRWSLAQASPGGFPDAEALMKYAVSAVLNRYIDGFFAPPEVFLSSSIKVSKEEVFKNAVKKIGSLGNLHSSSKGFALRRKSSSIAVTGDGGGLSVGEGSPTTVSPANPLDPSGTVWPDGQYNGGNEMVVADI